MVFHKISRSAVFLLGAIALAQPIPFYKDQEDYCYHNPQMPTCIKGKPLKIEDINGYLYKPKNDQSSTTAPKAVQPPTPTSPSTATPRRSVDWQSMRVQRGRGSASPAVIQIGELDWRFAHPHPDLLIGIDMENLLGSELMRTLLREWAGKLGATVQEQEKMLSGMSDVKRVLISIQNRDLLAMMIGKIDNVPVGVQLGGMKFTPISSDTVLMGTEAGSFGALTRLKLAALPDAQQQEPKLMARTYDFWVWGRADRLAGLGAGASGNSPVKKIKLGVSFRDGFNLQMILDTTDPASAARLLATMQKTAPQGLLGAVEGNSVRYAMVLDRDAALKRFAGLMTDSFGKQFAPLIAAARQISARQAAGARPSSGKIVIDGLDDGPKEVPLQKQ
jgi:hypothetical protein